MWEWRSWWWVVDPVPSPFFGGALWNRRSTLLILEAAMPLGAAFHTD